jgi:4'-phosphopantetheinyl transferase
MTLSDDERARARRFVFDRDRSRFTVARGVLRNILGRYLQRPPSSIRFGYGPHGKPHLEAPPNQLLPTLRFNVSHSADLVLIAVAHDREVGVDVEQIRTDFALDELARRFFSQEEVAAIELRTGYARAHAFFQCWTRKEAYIKVRGLALSTQALDGSLAVRQSVRLLIDRDAPSEDSRWEFAPIVVAPDFAAALAAQGHNFLIESWEWVPHA